ncbi:MAG: 50S ribosomal protein L22 [DPANN group archaeon]|nr:50S ribosomal protein L22 [DPANN group archaeon]
MTSTYAFKDVKENMARAKGIDLPISTKQSIEICNFLRGKRMDRVLAYLEEVKPGKNAIPFKRFNSDMGHRTGMGAGRYPVKAVHEIKKVLESAQTNAQFKGLNSGSLKIIHILANKAATPLHYGRRPSREMKRTHIEVVVQEVAPPQEKKRTKAKQGSATEKGVKGVQATPGKSSSASASPDKASPATPDVKADVKADVKQTVKTEMKTEEKAPRQEPLQPPKEHPDQQAKPATSPAPAKKQDQESPTTEDAK